MKFDLPTFAILCLNLVLKDNFFGFQVELEFCYHKVVLDNIWTSPLWSSFSL